MEDSKVKVTKTPDENPTIPDGKHWLTAVESVHFENDYGDEYNGYVIELDGVLYLAYEDPDDGYRSYSSLRPVAEGESFEIHNRFEPQLVVSESCRVTIDDPEDYFYEQDKQMFTLTNLRGGTVLEVTTDYSEDYYPVGWVKYHPEELPANLEPLVN